MHFQGQNTPAVVIVTDNFVPLARRLLNAAGCVDVPVLSTPNPVAYLKAAEFVERARQLVDSLHCALTEQRDA